MGRSFPGASTQKDPHHRTGHAGRDETAGQGAQGEPAEIGQAVGSDAAELDADGGEIGAIRLEKKKPCSAGVGTMAPRTS